MATYAELQTQIAELQAKAEQARIEELSGAIAQIHALMKQYGITVQDLQGTEKKTRKTSAPVAAKYRDPATGKEWTGRGREPLWLKDKNKDDFKI